MFLLAFSFSTLAQEKVKAKKANKEEVVILTSAKCDMCKDKIEQALKESKGVKDVNLNVESKEVLVAYNAKKTNPEKIRQVIASTGYDADKVKADSKAFESLPGCCKEEKKAAKTEKKGCCSEGKTGCKDKK